jgi:large subunit ribosomal protein L10
MRTEKTYISAEYVKWLTQSPFFVVVDYKGLSVGQFNELRKRLSKFGAELHVVKNTLFRVAARNAKLPDIGGSLAGQLAVVIGKKDLAGAAKVLKTYQAEFEKPKLQFGYLGNQALSAEELRSIADLPPLEVLQAKLLGVLNAPAQKLASVISAPGVQVARVLQAKVDKGA